MGKKSGFKERLASIKFIWEPAQVIATTLIAILLIMYDYRVDAQNSKNTRIQRSMALYTQFLEDKNIQEIVSVAHVTNLMYNAILSKDKSYLEAKKEYVSWIRGDENSKGSAGVAAREVANKKFFSEIARANENISHVFFPIEEMRAFETYISTVNRCMFGQLDYRSSDGSQVDIEKIRLASRSLERYRGPPIWRYYLPFVETGDAPVVYIDKKRVELGICDAKTTYTLLGDAVEKVFSELRPFIYCSGIYHNEERGRAAIEAFVASYHLWKGYNATYRDDLRAYQEKGMMIIDHNQNYCNKKKWEKWKDDVPASVLSQFLARRPNFIGRDRPLNGYNFDRRENYIWPVGDDSVKN